MKAGLNLTIEEKRTFRLHLAYSVLDGITLGILALNEFVFKKSLFGTDYHMGYLFQGSMVVMCFSILFNEILRRSSNKKRLLRMVAVFTRLPMLGFAFFPETFGYESGESIFNYLYLGLFFVYFLSGPITQPAINLLLKQNYSHTNFGKLYSYSTSTSRFLTFGTTFIFGLLLDLDNFSFRYVYPLMGLMSIISIYMFTMIDFREPENKHITKAIGNSLKESIRSMVTVVKTNKPYRDFEIGFMIYGFAFMITVSTLKIFLSEILMNYKSISFYLNLQVVLSILLLPWFGRLLGKIDPRKFAVITFSALFFYIFFMAMTAFYTEHFVIWGIEIYYTLIASYIFYAVFAATNGLLWWIGSAYFCKNEEAGLYQSIHLTLTGARALFAPVLGIYFYQIMGYSYTFLIGMIFVALAVFLMIWSSHNNKMK